MRIAPEGRGRTNEKRVAGMEIRCPHCQKDIELEEDLLGEKVVCPLCSGNFVVEAPSPSNSRKKRHPHSSGIHSRRKPHSSQSNLSHPTTHPGYQTAYEIRKKTSTLWILGALFAVGFLACLIAIIVVWGKHQYDAYQAYAISKTEEIGFDREVDRELALRYIPELHNAAYNQAATGTPSPQKAWHFFVDRDRYWTILKEKLEEKLDNLRKNQLQLTPQNLIGEWEGRIPNKNMSVRIVFRPDGTFTRRFFASNTSSSSPTREDTGKWEIANRSISWGGKKANDTVIYLNSRFMVLQSIKKQYLVFRRSGNVSAPPQNVAPRTSARNGAPAPVKTSSLRE
ncbi:MAG: hypothetical protein D6820_07800 [Lentisphaerae bacterium]|nr:MAG: hypothetical protein D6820_07800 [Lentisphaerota bacterium]